MKKKAGNFASVVLYTVPKRTNSLATLDTENAKRLSELPNETTDM